jgi:hypothetical protein
MSLRSALLSMTSGTALRTRHPYPRRRGKREASVAPFCAPDIVWDFRIARVKSERVGPQDRASSLGSGCCGGKHPICFRKN